MSLRLTEILLKKDDAPPSTGTRPKRPAEVDSLTGPGQSLHHVLPIRYPMFIGLLYQRLHSFGPVTMQIDLKQDLERLEQKLRGFKRARSARGQDEPLAYARVFPWVGFNLFAGPSGNLRTDDPRDGREVVKPHSFGQTQWDSLSAVKAAIDEMVREFTETGEGGWHVMLNRNIVVKDLATIIRKLEPIVQANKFYHAYHPSDWIVFDSDDDAWTKLTRSQNPDVAAIKKSYSALEVQKKLVKYGAPPPANGSPECTLFWRLRTPNEHAPAVTHASHPRMQLPQNQQGS